MKKIIYVLPRKPWPPYAGQARLAFWRAKILKELGYEVELIYICRNAKKILKNHKNELSKSFNKINYINIGFQDYLYICITVFFKSIICKLPLRTLLIFSPKIIKKYKNLIHKDLSDYVIHFYSAATYPLWAITNKRKGNFIIDMVDSGSLNIKRKIEVKRKIIDSIFWKYELYITSNFENNLPIYEFCRALLCVTSKDLNFFKFKENLSYNKTKFITSSVGVKIEKHENNLNKNSNKIIFYGSLWYEPNLTALFWLIENVINKVWKKNKNIEFIIAGSYPPKKLIDLCSKYKKISIIKNPDDMKKLIISSKISIAPMLSGSGQQFKIIESLSLGIPVVTTTIAANALELKNNSELLVADDPSKFAECILKLFYDKVLYENLSKKGKEFVYNNYDWNKIVKALINNIYY